MRNFLAYESKAVPPRIDQTASRSRRDQCPGGLRVDPVEAFVWGVVVALAPCVVAVAWILTREWSGDGPDQA